MSHWIDLRGATALVTGGSRGIGAAIVRTLAACGARCAVNYVTDADGRNRADAEAVVAAAPGAIAVEGEVSVPAQVARMVDQAVATLGGLDILVNNAGILRDHSMRKMTSNEWDLVLQVNLGGVFNVIKAATPHLRPGASIVNLASVSGSLGFFGQANYAASKAGVMALTKVAARELAKQKVRVNAVAPGFIDTEMTRAMPPDVLATFVEQVPLGRGGTPEDVAGAVLFLCSPMSTYVTGQVIHVNGGFFMGG